MDFAILLKQTRPSLESAGIPSGYFPLAKHGWQCHVTPSWMNELQHIEESLRDVARRRRWNRALLGLARGLFFGAAAAFLVYGLYKLVAIPPIVVPAAFIVAGAAGIMGGVIGWMRRMSLLETARWVDVRLGLKERLGTALELGARPGSEEWRQLVLHDAAAQLQRLHPRELVPIQVPQAGGAAALAMILCAGLVFVPAYRSQSWQQKQQEEARLRDTGRKLAELTRQTLQQKSPVLAPTQKAMTDVAELGDRIANVKLTRSEAMRDISSLADKLVQQTKRLEDSPAVRKMEKAARENTGAATSPEEMQKQLAALQDKLGQGAATADKLDQLQRSLEKLQQATAGLNDQNAKPSAAQREQLAQELSSLAKQAEEMGVPLSSLEEAIQAMKNGQTDLVLRDLETAMNDLEKLRDLAKSMQQLQQQIAKLGKDLAEQLQNGQVRAAQATLQKMINQLSAANLTLEQQQKMLEEILRATAPAGEYGKVKDYLEAAAQQMRAGRRDQAAQSLAAARKELDDLLQQMADAQAMDAMLAALSRAEAALAMNKSWDEAQSGTCPACGGYGCSLCQGRKPRWGHGGKPGPGVGTWADEQEGLSSFNPAEGMPDNSQVRRPDMNPRGHTERPDDLSPGLMPTKVRGQMSPGGSMPSITLKGVSIKGTSNVKFEEAAAAAQADAESALSQDKIPRAYQGTVREYFDDLKK